MFSSTSVSFFGIKNVAFHVLRLSEPLSHTHLFFSLVAWFLFVALAVIFVDCELAFFIASRFSEYACLFVFVYLRSLLCGGSGGLESEMLGEMGVCILLICLLTFLSISGLVFWGGGGGGGGIWKGCLF